MTFDWSDFLEVAKQLVTSGGSEAAWRSGVSRAYYALYHCARNYALEMHYPEPRVGQHQVLWDWFSSRGDTDLQQWALASQDLYWARVRADYKIKNAKMNNLNAEHWISEAERLLAQAEGFRSA